MFKKLLMVSALLASSSLMAASDGNLGPVSQGSTDVSIEKPMFVQISNIGNLNFGLHPFIPDGSVLEMFDDVCVFSSTGLYTLEVENGSSPGSDFMLTGQNTGVTFQYEFLWSSDTTGTTTGTHAPTSFYGNVGDAISPDCFQSTNGLIGARIQGGDYNIVPPDTYTSTVLLIVSPE